MSFAFVPRKFAKSVKLPAPPVTSSSNSTNISSTAHSQSQNISEEPKHDTKGKGKANEPLPLPKESKPKYTDTTLSSLICLSLSDYALWSDSDLRRKIDLSANEGFIPLTYLIHHSPHLRHLGIDTTQSQSQIIKSLRTHANNFVEIRLLVTQPSSSAWLGKGQQEKRSGYEIRRCDWDSVDTLSSKFSKNDWDMRTVYIENIPPIYRSIPGILNFTISLLPSLSLTSIQNIHLPPHHQDKPGDIPSCKGFALITFSSLSDAEDILTHWPWDEKKEDEDEDEVKKEAFNFGFRALSKKRWEDLKEEYIAYRQQLINEINTFQDASLLPQKNHHIEPSSSSKRPLPSAEETHVQSDRINPSSSYPPNVLLFIKNLHPGTNKTTLRKLFSTAFKDAIKEGKVSNDGVDYVDYGKGVDICYIRLSTPTHAHILQTYFTAHPTIHTFALDEVGSQDSAGKVITVDLVQGAREQLYWEKVPEKVRREAVDRGLKLASQKPVESLPSERVPEKRKRQEEPQEPQTQTDSPYPLNVLIFVKHVHPETNKTTLRKLFSRAFSETAKQGEGLGYIDFSKGMDSCYLRTSTPAHSHALLIYFAEHRIVQSSALDDTGKDTAPGKEITLELVQGTREALYWEKVPEKVRQAAVEKAIGGSGAEGEKGDGVGEGGRKRKRKRGKGGRE